VSFDFLFADFLEDGATAELPARSQTSHASPDAEWVPVSFAPVLVADSASSRSSSVGSNSSSSSSSNSTSSSCSSDATVVVDELVSSTTSVPLLLSAAMQAVHDTATQKLRTLQSAATVCQFALCDEFLESLQSGTYSRDTKVFICHTHARASFAKACTYALASVNKAKSHALLAAKAAAEADAAGSSENCGGHARKRHRAARACEACRIGKRRCERERGAATCNYCAARGMECVWSDSNDEDGDCDGDDDDDDNVVDAVLPVARSTPGVFSDALLEEMGLSDDVGSYATIKMPSGVAQALLLPIRSAAVLARRGMSIDGPTVVNMNDEFLALTGLSRSELQFSPVGVALAPQSRGAIINMLGIMRRFMSMPSDRHVVKTPMETAIYIHGTWYPGELTLTIVMRNRLPALVHVAVNRVLTDRPPIEPPLSTARVAQGGIPPDMLEPFLKHRQFVLNLLKTLKGK
jgi:hypothetical protein